MELPLPEQMLVAKRQTQVQANLHFIAPLPLYETEKPYLIPSPPKGVQGLKQTNIHKEIHKIEFNDVRALGKNRYTLDEHGFEYRSRNRLDMDDAASNHHERLKGGEDSIRQWLEDALGARSVIIFDIVFRDSSRIFVPHQGQTIFPPADIVHIDQTTEAGFKRVRYHQPESASNLLEDRVRIVNFWQPLCPIVHDWPLAVCSYPSLEKTRLYSTDLVQRHYLGELYYPSYHPDQDWYFLSEQRDNEALLLKCFDNDTNEDVAKYCAHSAFKVPPDDIHRKARLSIEMRALCFG